MDESLVSTGLALTCETCESEIEFPDEIASEIGICRQCGMAFLVGALDKEESGSRSA